MFIHGKCIHTLYVLCTCSANDHVILYISYSMVTLNRQHLKALHVKVEQLEEKEKLISLLKVKNKRLGILNDDVNERLRATKSYLDQTVER